VPADLVFGSRNFRREMIGFDVPGDIYAHVGGVDLIRDGDGRYLVLEDNLRTPSGVSYMLESREALKRIFAPCSTGTASAAIDQYPRELFETLRSVAPRSSGSEPSIVLLTPGAYNSAYFEHSFLGRQMGIEIVEARDLVVHRNRVFNRTTRGMQRVDVIYRRIDDDFLDPLAFRQDSLLGVPGLLNAYRAGQRDARQRDRHRRRRRQGDLPLRAGDDPLLPRRGGDPRQRADVHATDPDDLAYVLDHLEELVVKAVDQSGGYGMLIGPASTAEEREEFRA
jgi:uncharacterized circularly permuted ATP-grasp superfamily protein